MVFARLFFTVFAGYNLIAFAIVKASWAFGGFHFYMPEVHALHAEAPFWFHAVSTLIIAASGVLLLTANFSRYVSLGAIAMICVEHYLYHNSPHEPLQVALIACLLAILSITFVLHVWRSSEDDTDGSVIW